MSEPTCDQAESLHDADPNSSELPTPRGWFAIGCVDDIPPGTLKNCRIGGHELVAFRGADGGLAVVDAYCPHLGAHMGHGGTVEGNELRCPFHGFCFDRSGACTRTGYNTRPPPKARVRAWPLLVRHGVALVWHDPTGAAPSWEVPEIPMQGWSPFMFHHWRLRGHPQETTENSVDVGHFAFIHRYSELRTLEAAAAEGAHLRARYSFFKPLSHRLGNGIGFRNVIQVEVHGLGYSQVDVLEEQSGMRLRSLVLASPRGGGEIDLRAAVAVRDPRQDPDASPWLRALAPLLLSRASRRALLKTYCSDVEQDFHIWRNKRHIARPLLAQGDGPVGTFRKWARQFY